jgi:hypothetical protein
MNTDLTPAERAVVDNFTRQLGLALRRIAGIESATPAVHLPQAIPVAPATSPAEATPTRRKSKLRQEKQHEDHHQTDPGGTHLT